MLLMRTRSRSRLSALALCFLSSLYLADSQAPGDGHPTCLARNDGSHPEHVVYVRHLMDTRDYRQLLPFAGEDAVWQALDKDENNIIGGQTQVKTEQYNSILYVRREVLFSENITYYFFHEKLRKASLLTLFHIAIMCVRYVFYSGSSVVGLVHQNSLSVDMIMLLKITG